MAKSIREGIYQPWTYLQEETIPEGKKE